MHDNRHVQQFLSTFYSVTELCEHHRRADDIFSGVLELKTAGDTSTRSISRQQLFHILQWCPEITVRAVLEVTRGRLARQTAERYAALARVASNALERFIRRLPEGPGKRTARQSRDALDGPFFAELRATGLM
jgi:hypothetical protein